VSDEKTFVRQGFYVMRPLGATFGNDVPTIVGELTQSGWPA
jgi:hypothetical protein